MAENKDHEPHDAPRRLLRRDFEFEVPPELIAQAPPADRDGARLLVRTADGHLSHRHIRDLTSEIPTGTLLILNDTKVFPSRLHGHLTTGGAVELFLMAPAGERRWQALAKPMRKLKPGTELGFVAGLTARVIARHDTGAMPTVEVELSLPDDDFARWLDEHGTMPLPPYIERDKATPAVRALDRERYQTVYARERGSVAAPTAGLHFTDALLNRLRERSVEIAHVCLHVGGGTFLPVKTDDPRDHQMHAESIKVPRPTVDRLLAAKREGRPVVAVGTTTLRALESVFRIAQGLDAMPAAADRWHSTQLFLRPEHTDDRYRPQVIDGLITNFHQPGSTLFMLVAALIGVKAAHTMYRDAFAHKYRVFSYGDAQLLWL